ncbi:carboxylesterase/lipase family protein [Eisenbergiella porci]|uniref:carboxylesterase/lipase family protein n=1 Tax=Eisenbergiella porci TaxID=2652274 RepID=UPI002A7F200A|nr:carboxylesterase family protein [Eisenbergiella porci]
MLRKVKVKNGLLQGMTGKDPRITVFRGVPYAKPPVGELRWKAPQPAEDWEGVRKCYEYADMAMMRVHPGMDDDFYTKELHPVAAEYKMSEDCLYLNIFTPAKTTEDNIPVFVYIHGGGLQDGYSYEVEFDPERVARRGVIVVMVAYRLGLFGFLAHPEITARTPEGEVISNFGMQDQSMAIHWVYDNIRAFGGDPDNIVICGQSAGARSVQAQICTPLNDGLIKGAIIQSAVSMMFGDEDQSMAAIPSLQEAEKYGADFLQTIGIDSLEEAEKTDAHELMRRLDKASEKARYVFGLCTDGRFVRESAPSAYYNNRVADIPLIVGVCQGETQSPFIKGSLNYQEFLQKAKKYGDREAEFLRLAEVTNDEEADALMAGDAFNNFLAGTRGFCELRSSMGQKVYYYIFDHDIPGDDAGSFHGSDLWFMFDSLGNSWRPFEGKHYDLARQVTSYWTNFVKYKDPNGTDYNGNPLPLWEPYSRDKKAVMKFLDAPVPEILEECPVLDFRLSWGKEKLTDKE